MYVEFGRVSRNRTTAVFGAELCEVEARARRTALCESDKGSESWHHGRLKRFLCSGVSVFRRGFYAVHCLFIARDEKRHKVAYIALEDARRKGFLERYLIRLLVSSAF